MLDALNVRIDALPPSQLPPSPGIVVSEVGWEHRIPSTDVSQRNRIDGPEQIVVGPRAGPLAIAKTSDSLQQFLKRIRIVRVRIGVEVDDEIDFLLQRIFEHPVH